MSTIRLVAGLAAAGVAYSCSGQPIPNSPPDVLLQQALHQNRELLAIRQRADEARGLIRAAGVRPAITLDASGTTGRPLATKGEEQYSAGVSRTFETAGKRSLRIQAAEKELALAEAEYDERVRQLRFEIRIQYAEYSGTGERLRLLDALIDLYRKSFELMGARVAQGDAAALDRDLLSVELSRAAALRDAQTGRFEVSRTSLAAFAGLADPSEVPAPTPSVLPADAFDLERLKKTGLEQRPDLKILIALGAQGEVEVALARAQGHADVTLSAGYSRVYSRFDDQLGYTPSGNLAPLRDRDDVLRAGISVPLFSRGRNQGNVDAAVARSRAAQYRRQYLERSIPLEITGAWDRLNRARQAAFTFDQEVVGQSQKNLEVIRRAYALGQLRLLDVLNEQRRLLDTQLAGIDARVDALRALAELERAVGGELQ